ncbi:alpha/beta fold hydrolase [Gordonia sp. VNQ95]|uniref:alpha/beta fold hydrolase n=1 Tax=Gordonia sp. VNQ95 TaxID=3156619 RepID=UPI0032B3A107
MREYHEVTRTRDRARLDVQVRGSGPALLLLPGQANNHHWWDRVRDDFTGEYTTVTFDYRGTGHSTSGESRFTTKLFADDALTVMDSLAINRFAVYGTSMGGRTAQWLAARAPHRVRGLVLGCTTPGGTHAVERSAEVREALAGPDAENALLDYMYTPGWRDEHPGPYFVLGDDLMSEADRRAHLFASNRHDAWDVLPDIDCPTMILHGSDDLMAPVDNVALLADRIPNARSHIFDGARHAYFDECRDVADPLVSEFLAST